MAEKTMVLNKHRGGWAMLALVVVVAILAIIMAYYLPAVLERYSPSETADEEGRKQSTIEYVQGQLEPIDQRNQGVDDLIDPEANPDQEQSE